MASGKKNYFRHSFFARNDIKLLELRELVGVGFYFYYFTLLEQCGEESSDELKDKYVFHDSTIRKLWGINLKKCCTISEQMNAVGLLEFKKAQNTFEFRVPNLSKYLGKYESKFPSNVSNKRKEKKIKENKIESEDECVSHTDLLLVENVVECVKGEKQERQVKHFDFEAIYAMYPRKEGKKKGMERLKAKIKKTEDYEKLAISVKNYVTLTQGKDKQYLKHFDSFVSVWEDYLGIAQDDEEDLSCKIDWSTVQGDPFLEESLRAAMEEGGVAHGNNN